MTSCFHAKHGVEIRIWSLSGDNAHSWVFSQGVNKFVMDSNNNDTEVPNHCSTRILLLSFHLHEIPLNIDMKIIRAVSVSGSTLNFDSNSWTLVQRSNVVNPRKILYSNSIGSPSILSKALYSGEFFEPLQSVFPCNV